MKKNILSLALISCFALFSVPLRAVSISFQGAQGVNLSDYYVYFAEDVAADAAKLTANYGGTNFSFDTSNPAPGLWSVLTTNQVTLQDVVAAGGLTIDNMYAGRVYISYGSFGALTNGSGNYVSPAFEAGSPGSTTPFQFYEGNVGINGGQSTTGAGNFDDSYIDAFSFAYQMQKNGSSVNAIGATNFDPQFWRNQLQTVVNNNGFVTNNSGQVVRVLGNSQPQNPIQFASFDPYLNQLSKTNFLIGYTQYADTNTVPGRNPYGKQYGITSYSDGSNTYSNSGTTLAPWATFEATVITNSADLINSSNNYSFSFGVLTNITYSTNNDMGGYVTQTMSYTTNTEALLISGATIQTAIWGGSNSSTGNSPYTIANPYISSTQSNVAMLAQAYTTLNTATVTNNWTTYTTNAGIITTNFHSITNLITNAVQTSLTALIRQAPNYTNTMTGYSYNSAYSNFISNLTAINGITPGNVQEQQSLYMDDFYAALMLGYAGSTNIDPNTGIAYNKEVSAMWWGSTNLPVPQYSRVQSDSNNYDQYGGLIDIQTAGTAYGSAFSDRFQIPTGGIYQNFLGSDTLTVIVGAPLLNTTAVPEPSTSFLLGLGSLAGVVALMRSRRKS